MGSIVLVDSLAVDGGGGTERALRMQLGMAGVCSRTGDEGVLSTGLAESILAFSRMASIAELFELVMLRGDEGGAKSEPPLASFIINWPGLIAPKGFVEFALNLPTTPNCFLDSPRVNPNPVLLWLPDPPSIYWDKLNCNREQT